MERVRSLGRGRRRSSAPDPPGANDDDDRRLDTAVSAHDDDDDDFHWPTEVSRKRNARQEERRGKKSELRRSRSLGRSKSRSKSRGRIRSKSADRRAAKGGKSRKVPPQPPAKKSGIQRKDLPALLRIPSPPVEGSSSVLTDEQPRRNNYAADDASLASDVSALTMGTAGREFWGWDPKTRQKKGRAYAGNGRGGVIKKKKQDPAGASGGGRSQVVASTSKTRKSTSLMPFLSSLDVVPEGSSEMEQKIGSGSAGSGTKGSGGTANKLRRSSSKKKRGKSPRVRNIKLEPVEEVSSEMEKASGASNSSRSRVAKPKKPQGDNTGTGTPVIANRKGKSRNVMPKKSPPPSPSPPPPPPPPPSEPPAATRKKDKTTTTTTTTPVPSTPKFLTASPSSAIGLSDHSPEMLQLADPAFELLQLTTTGATTDRSVNANHDDDTILSSPSTPSSPPRGAAQATSSRRSGSQSRGFPLAPKPTGSISSSTDTTSKDRIAYYDTTSKSMAHDLLLPPKDAAAAVDDTNTDTDNATPSSTEGFPTTSSYDSNDNSLVLQSRTSFPPYSGMMGETSPRTPGSGSNGIVRFDTSNTEDAFIDAYKKVVYRNKRADAHNNKQKQQDAAVDTSPVRSTSTEETSNSSMSPDRSSNRSPDRTSSSNQARGDTSVAECKDKDKDKTLKSGLKKLVRVSSRKLMGAGKKDKNSYGIELDEKELTKQQEAINTRIPRRQDNQKGTECLYDEKELDQKGTECLYDEKELAEQQEAINTRSSYSVHSVHSVETGHQTLDAAKTDDDLGCVFSDLFGFDPLDFVDLDNWCRHPNLAQDTNTDHVSQTPQSLASTSFVSSDNDDRLLVPELDDKKEAAGIDPDRSSFANPRGVIFGGTLSGKTVTQDELAMSRSGATSLRRFRLSRKSSNKKVPSKHVQWS